MKRVLLLGAMAFLAINIVTMQNVNAQDKTKVTKTTATQNKTMKSADEIKMEKEKQGLNQATTTDAKEGKMTSAKKANAVTGKEVRTTATDSKKLNEKDPKASEQKKLNTVSSTAKATPNSMKPKKPVVKKEKKTTATTNAKKADR